MRTKTEYRPRRNTGQDGMRTNQDITHAIDDFGSAVWRACILHFKNSADAEDAFQETFIKYSIQDAQVFESEEHKKAWLLRVAANQCKDMLRKTKRSAAPIGGDVELSAQVDTKTQANEAEVIGVNAITGVDATQFDPQIAYIIEAIQNLEDPPRTPVYLAIYEGYSAPEIADMLDAPVNTVYSWVSRGKKLLREALR